jgi:hypothetical protein
MKFNLKFIPSLLICIGQYFLTIQSAGAAIGTQECGSYRSGVWGETREIISASFNIEGDGYALGYEIENRSTLHFNSDLTFSHENRKGLRIPYADKPLKISSDGKFYIGIMYNSYWCIYKGVVTISPEVSARLFNGRTSISSSQFPRPAQIVGQTLGSQINIRSAPSSNSDAPHYGLVGDRVTVLRQTQGDDDKTWYFIQFPSSATGWVRGDFIELQ